MKYIKQQEIKQKWLKKAAIEAHLEAKNIKTKYMLDEIEDSDEENYDDDSTIFSEEENEYTNLGYLYIVSKIILSFIVYKWKNSSKIFNVTLKVTI